MLSYSGFVQIKNFFLKFTEIFMEKLKAYLSENDPVLTFLWKESFWEKKTTEKCGI